MLGVVTSNGEKMPSVWFEQGYRLASVVYKEVLETKKIAKKSDYVFQQNGAPAHTTKTMQNRLDANMSFWFNDFVPHSHQISGDPTVTRPLDFSLWTHI